jgi:energy-coupling factor transporter ATP-binding protein EcfA2
MNKHLHRLCRVIGSSFHRGYLWLLLQFRMRLRYVTALVGICAILFPLIGWNIGTGISPVVLGGGLSTQILGQPMPLSVAIDPVLFVGLCILGIYWKWGDSEFQLRHRLYENIMIVPLKDTGGHYGDTAGSARAVQLETDRSVLVLGETGSGKTEAIKVLAYQLQADPDEPFVIFDYKQDYQQFFGDEHVIRLSTENSTVIWNVFREIRSDEECGEIAKAIFEGVETDNPYFTNAAAQVFADILRLLQRRARRRGMMPSNTDILTFLDGIDADALREAFIAEELSAQKHLPGGVEASSNIVSILEERVKAVFRGDFSKPGQFSVRSYMNDPRGQILILDFPIQQSSSVQPIFRLLIDWSIRFGLSDERGSYYLLDEFAALPELDMLERLINAGRAYNCYAILGVQAIPQLRATYGTDEAESLLSGLAQEIHLRVGQGSVEYCRKSLGRNRIKRNVGEETGDGWLQDENEDDQRVFEEYPVGENTLQNLDTGRGVVHTTSGRQWGHIYMLNEIQGRLLPNDRLSLPERVATLLWPEYERRRQKRPEIEPGTDASQPTPRLEEGS